MSGREFRVMWRREGRETHTQILQTQRGAREKVQRLKRIDAELAGDVEWRDPYDDPTDPHPLEGMPPLAYEPVVQERSVGEWRIQNGEEGS